MTNGLYIASAIGAIALYLMTPRAGFNPRKFGALLGALTLGGLWLYLWPSVKDQLTLSGQAFAYYYVFSAIAIASAVRVITHTKPVFAALWFVMLVLATAGLLLLLDSEFIAFAMIIIYGGAILVTYVFVIMLAAQSEDESLKQPAPMYDRVANEPVGAIVAGFVLLAVLSSVLFEQTIPVNRQSSLNDQQVISEVLTHRPEAKLHQQLAEQFGGADAVPPQLLNTQSLSNAERVGLDLFRSHPLGLELAGVILLVSLIGAVVIARSRVGDPDEPEDIPG